MSLTRPGLAAALLLAAVAGACKPTAGAPPAAVASAAPPLTPPGFHLPGGTGCGGEIARTKAVIDNDVTTGNLNKPVGDRFSAEVDRAAVACAAGREGEAMAELGAAKARYGYR